MKRVVFDEQLRKKLESLRERAEIADESGSRLGYFMPEHVYHRLIYDWANAQFTDEELERARQDPRRYTTAEVLEYLKSL